MIFGTNKEKGNAGMALAIAYFGANGYTVSIPLNDTQEYDLIIDDGSKLFKVQCKATGSKTGEIDFRSKGGTSSKIYAHVLDSDVDLIFCLDEDGTKYLIPVKDIPRQNTIKLRKEKPSKGFDTSKYIVQI